MEKIQSQPTSLLSLPPDIHTQILSHLVSSFGKPTIQAVLRTCKQLYEVALPLSVGVFRNTAPYIKGGGPCSRARNVQFLRYIIISKPELAIHVKSVVLGSFSSGSFSPGQYRARHRKDVAQPQDTKSTKKEIAIYGKTIEAILARLNLRQKSDWCANWIEDLRKGYSDAQIALILLVCPNIQALLFEQSTKPRQFIRLLETIGSLCNPSRPCGDVQFNQSNIPLSKVQDVFHESTVLRKGYNTFYKQAPILFHLPNLRFYECNFAFGNEIAAEKFKHLPPRSCPVEEIALRTSAISGPMLFNMLKACRAVKKLEYTQYSFVEATMKIMPQEFLEAMLLHADTLEEVYINMEEWWDKGWKWKDHPEKLYMGTNLSRLHSLKKLTISMQCLTGILAGPPDNNFAYWNAMPLEVEKAPSIIECLPESIEYLNIISCGEAIWEKATELLRTVEQGQRFKKLTYICLIFNEWLMKSELDLHCYSPHVEFEVDYQCRDWYLYDLGYPNRKSKKRGAHNETSRIYAPDVRKVYLEIRTSAGYRTAYESKVDPDEFEE